jgi:uncharacterized membrane protein HdeD (DUF308 family)
LDLVLTPVLELAKTILGIAVPALIVLAFFVRFFPKLDNGTTLFFLYLLAFLFSFYAAARIGTEEHLNFEQLLALLGIVTAVFGILIGATSLAISYDEYLARKRREVP